MRSMFTAMAVTGAGCLVAAGALLAPVAAGQDYLRQRQGDTPGTFIPGDEGVISWEMPADLGGSPGQTLKAPTADTKKSQGVPGVVSRLLDADEAGGKTWVVGPCAVQGAAPAAPLPAAPAGAPSVGEVLTGRLDVTVASRRLPRAKRIRRSLTLGLRSKAGVTDLRARLYQGARTKRRVVGTGTLAAVTPARSSSSGSPSGSGAGATRSC